MKINKINQTQINIFFPKIIDLRNQFIKNEHLLKDYFLPGTILNLPPQIDENVPRIIVQSKNGHSTLNISLSNVAFTTLYDNEYVNNWDLCNKYINSRVSKIYELVDILTEKRNYYVGLTVFFELNDIDDVAVNIIKNKLLNKDLSIFNSLYGVACNFVYVVNEKYFVNLSIHDVRNNLDSYGKIINGEMQRSIGIVLDINDRYVLNKNNAYISNCDSFNEINSIVNKIMNNEIVNFINNGSFNI